MSLLAVSELRGNDNTCTTILTFCCVTCEILSLALMGERIKFSMGWLDSASSPEDIFKENYQLHKVARRIEKLEGLGDNVPHWGPGTKPR